MNITIQGRLVNTFLTSSRSEAFWPGGGLHSLARRGERDQVQHDDRSAEDAPW